MSVDNTLGYDTLFHVLRVERRRSVIRLVNAHEEITHSDAAEHIAAEEAGTTVENVPAQPRKAVYIALHQSHLPELVDAGIVEWENGRTISAGDNFRHALEQLTFADSTMDGEGLTQRLRTFGRGLVGGRK